MNKSLRNSATALSDRLVAWRRRFHAHPELSGQEEQTARFIAAELRRMGYEPQEHIGGTFGLIATLRIDGEGAIALRADMDALPITEETGLECASRSAGVMHACGHDAHMAMLLGAAQLLSDRRSELKRAVTLVFQAHEEQRPGGATPLIASGALDHVTRIFGLHIWSEMPTGTLGARVGPFMSGVTDFRITITGRGGHAAMPHQCVDPIVVGAEMVTALQTVISRSIAMTEEGVVSVTQFHAGSANNVIPSVAELHGTVRALSETVRSTIERRVREIAAHIAAAHGALASIELLAGYPLLVNDRETVERALRAARRIGFQEEQVIALPVQGGGEDFAYYAQKMPAALLFLGARNEAKGCVFPHHHPRFNIDEDALSLGAALLAEFAFDPTESAR